MTSDWIALAVGFLLTVGTGLFVASEFSLVNLDRAEIEARQERGESMLGPVIRGLKRNGDAPLERTARHHADDPHHRASSSSRR
jgi:CBS domain containing-hemolysin-like protein